MGKVMRLVFSYTHCDGVDCKDLNKPFEYCSKDKFVLDVLANPMLLEELGICNVYDFQIEDGEIYEKEYVKNIDKYIFTLEEWFDKNKKS